MLRPWFEYHQIYLEPGRAKWARIRRIPHARREVAEIEVPVESPFAALKTVLGEAPLPIRLNLSGRYAHVLTIPWQASLETSAEWEAYGQHACASIFRGQPGDWRIGLSRQGYGQPVIMAAVDQVLYRHAVSELQEQGRRLLSMEPYAACVLNRFRRTLGNDFWLFVTEPGTCTAWYARGGAIHTVLAHPLEENWRESLAAVVMREIAKKGDALPPPVFVHAHKPTGRMENAGVVELHLLHDEGFLL